MFETRYLVSYGTGGLIDGLSANDSVDGTSPSPTAAVELGVSHPHPGFGPPEGGTPSVV